MEITLARALKLKNRLTEQLNKAVNDVRKYNSIRSELSRPVDIQNTWKEHIDLRNKLVELKTAIGLANAPILSCIYRMAEIKAELTFLSALDVTDGSVVQVARGMVAEDKIVEHNAFVNKKKADEYTQQLKDEFDSMQEKIDIFNAQTKINIDFYA